MRVADNRIATVLGLYKSELAALYPEEEAKAIARAVFQERMGMDMADLALHAQDSLSESDLLKVYDPLKRLAAGEPLQYVLGQVHFHGLPVHVGPGVLIPRPETEELVDHILRAGYTPSSIVDVGTGSGCIALALKRSFPEADVVGVDVSTQALMIAASNAKHNGLAVEWIEVDVLANSFKLPACDLIVSNPPYVPRAESGTLDPQVRDHEPHVALFVDDADPQLFFRRIGELAFATLPAQGQLWFEGHYRHASETGELLRRIGFTDVQMITDLSGNPRFIHATR